jgi:hypothetical protein
MTTRKSSTSYSSNISSIRRHRWRWLPCLSEGTKKSETLIQQQKEQLQMQIESRHAGEIIETTTGATTDGVIITFITPRSERTAGSVYSSSATGTVSAPLPKSAPPRSSAQPVSW